MAHSNFENSCIRLSLQAQIPTNIMPLYLKSRSSRNIVARLENYSFYIFCVSTIFIAVFSVGAIHNWPQFVKRFSILISCILPAGLLVISRLPAWFHEKQIPKEAIWVFSVFFLGLMSSLFCENQWATFKFIILFIVSGPLVFLSTFYFFEVKKNQEIFLWLTSIGILVLSLFGIYEYNFTYGIRLFSDNPLPAGAMLIILSASPIILLRHKKLKASKIILILSLLFSVIVILLLAKKGPFIGMILTVFFLCLFFDRKYFKYFLVFILMAGLILSYLIKSSPTSKDLIRYKSSIALRVENYIFGLYIFKNNPLWGIGTDADLLKHLDKYAIKTSNQTKKSKYRKYVKWAKTFENIVVAFLVEMGGLFSVVYFGGLLYFILGYWKSRREHSIYDANTRIITSVLIGFAAISLTFDTLKFPNLNWLFHCLLGLMANQTISYSEDTILLNTQSPKNSQ